MNKNTKIIIGIGIGLGVAYWLYNKKGKDAKKKSSLAPATSVAISDAIAAIKTPVVEVHISNIYSREEYRHISLTGKNCKGVLTGFGLPGYKMALDSFL